MSRRQMSAADAAWLHMDRPTNLMVVNGVLWLADPLTPERAAAVVRERLVERFPRLRQRVVEPATGVGLPSWEDDPGFALERHVHHRALPAPGDGAALQELSGDLISMPLDRSKPLWDVYVVDNYGRGSALVVRMHHCIADGIALSRVLLSMTDAHPDAGIEHARAPGGERGRLDAVTRPIAAGAHLADSAVHEGFALLSHPRAQLSDLLTRSGAELRAFRRLLLTGADTPSVLRGELGTTQRVAWTDHVSLAEVKATGAATGTTVNDVLVAAMTGALHRYLVGRRSLVDELRAMIPFNLRPLDEPLPRELGNRFGLVYLDLPVGIRGPRRRLVEIHRRMDAIKHSPEAALSYGILGLVGLTPPQIEQRLVDLFSSKTSAVMTNVPGPREPVYLAGVRVAGVLPFVPAAGPIGLGVSIFSYAGGVTVGIRGDAGLIPDPEALVAAFEHELATMSRLGTRREPAAAAYSGRPA